MAHPSTGYTLARTMMGATAVAKAIQEGLLVGEGGPDSDVDLVDKVAASAYNATMWSSENIHQRNFAVFGGNKIHDIVIISAYFRGNFNLDLYILNN